MAALVAALVAGIIGWVHGSGGSVNLGSGGKAGGTRLRLLASDELADMEDLLTGFTRDTGLQVEVRYQPVDELLRTAASPGFGRDIDAVWVPVNGARHLPETIESRLETGTVVMTSPLVLGVRREAATRLGSRTSNLTWQDLIATPQPHPFTFGMVTPNGRSDRNEDDAALLGIATGLAGTQDVLTPHALYQVAPRLRALHDRQTLSASTSTALVRGFQTARAADVDALLTHESQILRINATNAVGSPLTLLAPGRQAVFTRYVLRPLLSPSHRMPREELHSLTAYLMSPRSQEWIARRTFRRPATTGANAPDPAFSSVQALQMPRLQGILDRTVQIYRGDFRYPRIVFALDVSGSMRGQGMKDLRRAFATLGRTIAARTGTDVQILLIPFATAPRATRTIELNAADPDPGMILLARSVNRLEPGGNTAIYAALQQADDETATRAGAGDVRATSVILVTDGRNTGSTDLSAFLRHRQILQHRWCATDPPAQCPVPVFPVLTADADPEEMRRLAAATGGQVSNARTVDLGRILRGLTGRH